MITADPAPVFPACPTYGFTTAPNFLVKFTPREGGFERAQRVWDRPLIDFNGVPLGERPQADIEAVYIFWMAMGGMATKFRFLDPVDHMSCLLGDEPSAVDQPLEPRTAGGYYLVKEYVAGSIVQLRDVQRPIGSSIQVANEVGEVQAASSWTLDESTGVLTPGGGFTGTPTSWGGEFHTWVRFSAQFQPSISNLRIMQATVQLSEKRQALA